MSRINNIYAEEVELKFERLISCEKCLNIAKKPHQFTTCWHTCCYECGKVCADCPACGVPCPAAEFRYDPSLERQIIEYMKLKKILLRRKELGGFTRCIEHSPCRRQEPEILEVESRVEEPYLHCSRSKSMSPLFSQRSSRPETKILSSSSDGSVNQDFRGFPSQESKTPSDDQQSSETVILITSNTEISPASGKTLNHAVSPLGIVINSFDSKIPSPVQPEIGSFNPLPENENYLNSSTAVKITSGSRNVLITPQSRKSKYHKLSRNTSQNNSSLPQVVIDNELVEPVDKLKVIESEVLTSLANMPSPNETEMFSSSEDMPSSITFITDSKQLLIDQSPFHFDIKIQEESLVTSSDPIINLNDITPNRLQSRGSSSVHHSQFHKTVPVYSATHSVRNKRSLSGQRKQNGDSMNALGNTGMQTPAYTNTPARIKKPKLASNMLKRHSTPVKSVDTVVKNPTENTIPTKQIVSSANAKDVLAYVSDMPMKEKSKSVAIIAVESLTPTTSVSIRCSQKKRKGKPLIHSPSAMAPSSSLNPSPPKSSPQAVVDTDHRNHTAPSSSLKPSLLKRSPQAVVDINKRNHTASSSSLTPSPLKNSPQAVVDNNKRNHKGESQLHAACTKGQMSRVEELLALGANPNCKDHAGWTPLHEAVKLKNHLLVRRLLDSGARVGTPGLENTTPLHSAVYSGDEAVILLLLACGADPNARDLYGNTPRMIAEGSTLAILEGHSHTVVSRVEGYAEIGRTTLLADGLTKEQEDRLRLFARQFGLLLVTKFFNAKRPAVTHLVVPSNPCPLTCNVLHGILQGCFIVTFEWIERCFKCDKVIDAEGFEVSGTNKFPTSDGPRRGRHNARQMLPRLLSGCHIFLANRSEGMAEVIAKSSGALMLTREPNPEAITPKESTVLYHADRTSPLAECSHIILFDPEAKVQPSIKYNMTHTKALPLGWLLESIQTFSIADPS